MDIQEAGLQLVQRAKYEPKYRSILMHLLANNCNKIIIEAGYSTFQKLDAEDKKARIDSLFRLCIELRFSWLNYSDLNYLIGRGLIGEFGEYYDLTPKELNRWIKSYLDKNIDKINARSKERNLPVLSKINDDDSLNEFLKAHYNKAIEDLMQLKIKYTNLEYFHFLSLNADFDYGSLFMSKIFALGILKEPNENEMKCFYNLHIDYFKGSSLTISKYMQNKFISNPDRIARFDKLCQLLNHIEIDEIKPYFQNHGLFKENKKSLVG